MAYDLIHCRKRSLSRHSQWKCSRLPRFKIPTGQCLKIS